MSRIEICGIIASGKTTLCHGLMKKGYDPIFEEFQKNPFYEKFYEDPIAYSFETEITFLLQHYHSIKIQKTNTFLVCDYSLLLDLAYADINLSGNRHKIFCEIVSEIHNEIDLPSKIIHLSCPEEVCLQRIKDRSRDAETSITIAYLRALDKALSRRVEDLVNQVQVVKIDSHAIDFRWGIEAIPDYESI